MSGGFYVCDLLSGSNAIYPVSADGLLGDGIVLGGGFIWDVAFSPDGTIAYVVRNGALDVIDVASGTVIDTVACGTQCESIAVTPDGAKAYAADFEDDVLRVIDLSTPTAPVVSGFISVAHNPFDVVITPDGAKAYVSSWGASKVTPIDVATDTAGATITVGTRPAGLAITPDGTKLYVTDDADDTVTPIDTGTNTAGTPFAVGSHPRGVAISPDGTKAYVCNYYDGTLTPVDVATDTPGAPISGLGSALDVAFTADGATAAVSTNGAQMVDVATDTLGVRTADPPEGGGIAFSPIVDVEPPPPPVEGLFVKIYDLCVTELADISAIALEKNMARIANGPCAFTVQAPANDPLLTAIAEDGFPILGDGGNRKLVVWENSDPDTTDPIFHGRIFGCERDSDENSRLVTITAFDPWVELGFEADDRGGRIVRDGTPAVRGDQNFLTLHFTGSVVGQSEISGPDLIRQVLTYCQADPTADPIQGAGPLPIDVYSGEWDLDVPPAIDLDPRDTLDWPTLVGDFIQQLIDTNVVDFDLRPIRPGTGKNPAGEIDDYIMVEASAKSKLGTDLTDTVHFDHLTGSFNAKGAREVTDFSKQNSHLWYELGPRLANEKWRAQLQPHDQPLHADLLPLIDAAAAKYGGCADHGEYGYNEFIRVFDSLGTESSSRPLYEALYRYEIMLRLEPRKLLYITPNDGDKALFQAPQDFDAFDLIQINIGADFGKEIDAEAQRCYGYTKTWTRENVSSLGQLLTSADVG